MLTSRAPRTRSGGCCFTWLVPARGRRYISLRKRQTQLLKVLCMRCPALKKPAQVGALSVACLGYGSQAEEAMIRSTNQELNEYEIVSQPKHIDTVWKVVEATLPKYWELFVKGEHQNTPAAKLAAK